MTDTWTQMSLGEVLKLEYGKPLEDGHRKADGRYPVYGANGEKDRTDKGFFKKPSIIVGRKGSAGEVNLTEPIFWPLDVTYFVTFDEAKHDLRFLYYLLTIQDLPKLARGVKPGINRNEVYAIEAKIPTIGEQKRIVRVLDEAFEGIAVAKANAEKNLRHSRFLLRADIDEAIAGRLTRQWRLRNSRVEKVADLIESRSRGQRGHSNGPVGTKAIKMPGSWALASPEQVANHIVDCPHSTPKWTTSGVVCLRTTNFKPGILDLESVQFVSEHTYTERIARIEPQGGDVLYSREGGILGIACVMPHGLRACLGQRMMLFRLDENLALPEYFSAVMNSTMILALVKDLTGGAAAPHLNVGDIRRFPIPLPPITEQREIVASLGDITAKTRRLESLYLQKLAALEALKKSLLHQAFTGRL